MSVLCAHSLFWAQEQHEWKFNSEVGRLELVLRQAHQVCERHDKQHGRDHRADASRGQNENTGEGFTGATVLDPSVGLKENVIALDLTSLYPTMFDREGGDQVRPR